MLKQAMDERLIDIPKIKKPVDQQTSGPTKLEIQYEMMMKGQNISFHCYQLASSMLTTKKNFKRIELNIEGSLKVFQ